MHLVYRLYTLIGTKNGGAPNSGSPAFIHPFPSSSSSSSFSIFILSLGVSSPSQRFIGVTSPFNFFFLRFFFNIQLQIQTSIENHPFPSSFPSLFPILIISCWSSVSIQCFQSFISSFKIHIHIEAGEFIAIIQYFMDNKYTPKIKIKLCYFSTLLYTFSSYPSCKLLLYFLLFSTRLSSVHQQSQLKSRPELQSCNQSKPIRSFQT